MDKQILCQFFSNPLLFHNISEYLNVEEILKLCTLSKEMKYIVEGACRHILKENNINKISNKSAINRMQFYLNRCLRIVKDDKEMKNSKTIWHPFKFEIINFFEVGSMYTCYLTKNNKATIFRTSTFIDENVDQQIQSYEIKKNIRDVKCKSEKVILTKTTGEVSLISTNKYTHEIIQLEEKIEWTNFIPIQKVQSSFNYAVFFPENKTNLNHLFHYVFGQPSSKYVFQKTTDEHETYLIVKNMLSNTEHILHIPCQEIVECTVGHKSAFFLSDQYECFYIDFELNNEEERYLKGRLFPGLAGKSIVKISNGYNFFIALERNMQNFENWNNERVLKWLKQIGFGDYLRIAKVEKLDGKRLKNIEKTYMINVLGITKQNMQQKLFTSIDEEMKKKSHQDQLYGWGKNQFGQLGSSSANYIGKPKKIKVNCLSESEYIDCIFCGWFQTFIRTQKGRIFCTVSKNQRMKKREREGEKNQNKQSDSDETEYKPNKNKKKKKKLGNDVRQKEEKKVKKQRKFEEEENWYLSPLGKAFFVQAFKDLTFYVQCPNQHKEEPDKRKKLRTAKTILNKILWSSLNKDEFKVGYVDNEFGLIEMNAGDLELFDVKEGRVKYFKRNGMIIWDRQNKIDYL